MEREIVHKFRKEFPVTEKHIYLDHAGIAPVSRRVEEATCRFVRESAEHAAFFYPDWTKRTTDVRKQCAGLLHAEAEEIAFVRSTSHGLSLVAEGLAWADGENVLVFEKEFPSNLYPWRHLKRKGVEMRIIPSKDGRIELDDIEGLMDERTRLLSISSVQFTNGFRADLLRTGELCRRRGILFCVDAIQSLGVIPMDVERYQIDFLAADAHKWLLGPEGIGIFYCRRELVERLDPALVGWKSVKRELSFEMPDFDLKTDAQRFEEGSQNLLGIFGMGAAIELLMEVGIENIEERVLEMGESIIREAERRGFLVKTPREKQSRGGNITISGPFDPVLMRDALKNRGIMVNVRAGGLRISPHFYNTEEEVTACFREIDKIRS